MIYGEAASQIDDLSASSFSGAPDGHKEAIIE